MTRRRWVLAGAVLVVAVAAAGGVVAVSDAKPANSAAQGLPVKTARVEKGRLSGMVSQYGTLTYRAGPDGSPYVVINRARGTYTKLPNSGGRAGCGDVLYRVDDHPVLLLCGSTPAYRSLSQGDSGPDVTELNANLVHLGYATRAQLDPSSGQFSAETASALKKLQSKLGEDQTGALALGQAVFLPQPVRIATVAAELAGFAQPGSKVLSATSDTLEVEVNLDPSQQDEVKTGDFAQITLPDNHTVPGMVTRIGTIASSSGSGAGSSSPTIPIYVTLKYPRAAGSLDQAPVQVQITTAGVTNALNVPVTAIVGKSSGGFAVEVVRAGGRRALVAVKLGLFDDADGRVQVEGDLRQGDRVVVPSS